jgi:hypothetical protein
MKRQVTVCRSVGRLAALTLLGAVLLVLLPPLLPASWPQAAPAACAAEGGRSRLVLLMGEGGVEAPADSLTVLVPGDASGGTPGETQPDTRDQRQADERVGRRNNKLIGTTFFASGAFLCSWGISSWQVDEYQCCPPRNTENVIKIVVGVVLLNAGLFYLLGGAD